MFILDIYNSHAFRLTNLGGGIIKSMNRKVYGFTIVELLIVIVVIGILATISIVAYNGVQRQTHIAVVRSDLANNAKKLEEYKILNGKYPESSAEFNAAKLKFSRGSHRHVGYCVRNNSSGSDWAIVSRVMPADSGFSLYLTSKGSGESNAAGVWSNNSTVCTAAGLADYTAMLWVRGSGDWATWLTD